MTVAIAEIFAVRQAIDDPGPEMIHAANILVLAPGGVAALLQFLCESLRSFLGARAVKIGKIARHEVAGVGRNDIQKTGLLLRVTDGFERDDMFLRAVHSETISGVIPRAPSRRGSRPHAPS